jgi:hypothetical protein
VGDAFNAIVVLLIISVVCIAIEVRRPFRKLR